ncbi:putative dehydrogenase [Pseudomonas aeruginosa]|nr:putative dehydrogenase [Pseudomonas aeruginosa]
MGLNLLRERYRVDLASLQATCEANYARLMRLLPDMREAQASRRVALSEGERLLGVLALEVTEACPYTTTLQVRQELGLPWLPAPRLEVRVYHDARMAEVIGAEQARRLMAIYPYPNQAMHQPDEKNQLNLFLGEWLAHCLACGHEMVPVASAERLQAKGQLNGIKPKVVLATVICSAFRVCRHFRRSP